MWIFDEIVAWLAINLLGDNAYVWVRRIAFAIAVGFIVWGLVTGHTAVAMFGFLVIVLVVLPRLFLYRE